MPIYEQSYRSYEGRLKHRFRWMIIIEQEWRTLHQARVFRFLMFGAIIHFTLRLLQVLAYDIVVQDPNSMLRPVFSQIKAISVNEKMFFQFLMVQIPLVFVTFLYAGSGMICNDFRNNLMEVYFSKPITWLDYALGKIFTLATIGLMMTLVPAIFLVALHNVLLPTWETWNASYWWPGAISIFSLAIVLPMATAILASSCLLRNQAYAAIAIFMLVIANTAVATMLAESLRKSDYLIISFPAAVVRIGEHAFRSAHPKFPFDWRWAILYTVLVVAVSMWIIFRKVRRAEIAA